MIRLAFGLIAAAILFAIPAWADFKYPQLPKTGSELSDWILPGWKATHEQKGDLNKDGRADIALILERNEPVKHVRRCSKDPDTSDAAPRILLILLARKEGGYSLSASEANLVLRSDEGGIFGDPLDGLLIERGSLVLHHYGGSAWRWFQTYRFRSQDGGWYLIGFTDGWNHNVSRLSTTYDYNALTGKVEITATDEKGRPGCYQCMPGEKCPAMGRCEKGKRQARSEVTTLKTRKRPLISLDKTY
jgi:hypothetical protein